MASAAMMTKTHCLSWSMSIAPKQPLEYVISLNLKRRHLDESQRAWVASRIETMKQGRPEKDANLHVSRSDAASMLNVSERSVASAARVRDDGDETLKEAVAQGRVKVSTADDIATQTQEEQCKIVGRTLFTYDNYSNIVKIVLLNWESDV
jgi:hypothetical protein